MFHLHVSRSLYQFQVHGRAPRRYGVYDQMEQLFTNRKFYFRSHRNFWVFFLNGKHPLSSAGLQSREKRKPQPPGGWGGGGGGGTWVNVCWVCAAGLSESPPLYSLPYFWAKYRPHLSHFVEYVIFVIPT